MTPKFLQACEFFQPAEKACWEILLRESGAAEIASKNDLERAMTRTLTELWSLVGQRNRARWLRTHRAAVAPFPGTTGCGVAPLLVYFGTGERALELIVREIERAHPQLSEPRRIRQRERIKIAFELLVQRELEALCGSCRTAGPCSLRGFRTAPAPAAANEIQKPRPRSRRLKAPRPGPP